MLREDTGSKIEGNKFEDNNFQGNNFQGKKAKNQESQAHQTASPQFSAPGPQSSPHPVPTKIELYPGHYPAPLHLLHFFPYGIPPALIYDPNFVYGVLFPTPPNHINPQVPPEYLASVDARQAPSSLPQKFPYRQNMPLPVFGHSQTVKTNYAYHSGLEYCYPGQNYRENGFCHQQQQSSNFQPIAQKFENAENCLKTKNSSKIGDFRNFENMGKNEKFDNFVYQGMQENDYYQYQSGYNQNFGVQPNYVYSGEQGSSSSYNNQYRHNWVNGGKQSNGESWGSQNGYQPNRSEKNGIGSKRTFEFPKNPYSRGHGHYRSPL